jgi:hypothetical protein
LAFKPPFRQSSNVSWTTSWYFYCFALVRLSLPDQPIYLLIIHLSGNLASLFLGFSVLLDRTVAYGLEEVKLNRIALTPYPGVEEQIWVSVCA